MKMSMISFLILFFLVIQTKTSFAQWDILDKVKEKVEQKAEEKADEAIDKGVDEAAKKATEKKQKEDNEENQADETTVEKTVANTTNTDDKPKTSEASLKSFSKFDFVPGDKVFYFEDFSQDNVGDFPARWNTNGSGEVVTINKYPGKWLKTKGGSLYVPDLSIPFPENYTIEFDMIADGDIGDNILGNINFMIIATDGRKDYLQHPYTYHDVSPNNLAVEIELRNIGACRFFASNFSNSNYNPVNSEVDDHIIEGKFGKIIKVSVAVQKQRFRLWVDGKKLYDLPKFVPPANYDAFKLGLWYFGDNPEVYQMLFSNFRFAAGLPDMRNKLLTDGKLVTHGINFDVNSDKIKPESYGTLKEIANILKDNPSIKVKIIGHTDSDGADAANMELSKKRSASVKNALSGEFSIDASRMETDGKGESEPLSDNNTIEGKANNRRVEFIKL